MRLLFVGGTGLLSAPCAELAIERGCELFLITRGRAAKYPLPEGAHGILADVRSDAETIRRALRGLRFDAIVDFVAFDRSDVERDVASWRGLTDQYVFISSASAYQKPPRWYLVTEATPLENPFWEYSRGKIACENFLSDAAQRDSFPVTIVRPSLTYGPSQIPFCVGSWEHPWTVIDRMLRGAPVIVPGDGTSLWVLTWSGDFAKGLVGLLGQPDAIGRSFNITSDEVLTWDQIFLEAYAALDREPKIMHIPSELIAAYWPHAGGSLMGDKMHSLVFDNTAIRRIVPDFACDVTWSQGLRRSILWHESHPQFKTVDDGFNDRMDALARAYRSAFP